jgi:hypothetical protein
LGEREGEQVEEVDLGLYWSLALPCHCVPAWLELELALLQPDDWPEVDEAEDQLPVEPAAVEEPGEAKPEEEDEEEQEQEEISGGS